MKKDASQSALREEKPGRKERWPGAFWVDSTRGWTLLSPSHIAGLLWLVFSLSREVVFVVVVCLGCLFCFGL